MKVTKYVVFPIVWFIALSFVFDAALRPSKARRRPN